MRWSMKLKSPAVLAGREAIQTPGPEHHQLCLGPDAAGRRAWVSIVFDGRAIEVTALAEGTQNPGSKPDHPEWYNRAYLAVLLNPGHDHITRRLYAVDDRGEVVREAHWIAQGEEAGDEGSNRLEDPPRATGSFTPMADGKFLACLRIPTDGFRATAGQPVGFRVKVGFHELAITESLNWPERVDWTGDTPLAFGDLYLEEARLAVREIEIVEPVWGGDPSPVVLRGRLNGGASRSGEVRVRLVLPGDGEYEQEGIAWHARGEEVELSVPVVFSFRAKWANGMLNIARLHLAVVGEDGQVLWEGRFPFGFDHGIIVRERFGRQGGSRMDRPVVGDPDFLNGFRAYLLSGLPDFRLRTTREGAPSDFYLEDPAGEANLDLSAADSLDRVVAMLTERFPDWQDALCAAAMWIHHPAVTRHSSTWSRVSNTASVDSIPRLAGCFCGDTSRLGAVLAEKIGQQLGVPLKGFSMGLRGHLATLVETPIGAVVIDGMMGLWFHTLENTRLATLDEMRACREIAERVWYYPRAHGQEYFYGVYNQLIRPWRSGSMVWPDGSEK